MAQFDAGINLSVNASDALRGITKVERKLGDSNNAATAFNKTLKESVDTLRRLNNVASKIRSPFELAAAQKANTLLNQQVNAARERLKIRQAEVRVIERAQRAQKALPGTALESQRRLPARTSGVPIQARAEQESARITEQQNRELFTARQRRINAEERLARALEGEVNNVVRTRTGQGPFGLLPAKTSGVPVQVRREQLQAAAAEKAARVATEDVAKAARQQAEEQQTILRATARRAEAEEKLATAAEGQVSKNTRLGAFGPDSQKLLPAAGSTTPSRREKVIAAEVERQFNLYGRLTPELERLAVAYANQRGSAEELTSAQDQLTAEVKRRRRIDSESVTALGGRQQRLQAGLNRQNSASEGALKTATKLLAIEERLTAEQRAQLDLIRTVKGIRDNITGKTITELESTKGRKSIEIRKKREAFLFERINKLAISTTKQEKLKNDVLEISKRLRKGELEEARKLTAELNKQIKAEKTKGKGKSGRNRLGGALVGGAFPVLFGGGPTSIAGGFIGELFGPLGGVVGSALGSQIDAYVQGITKLAQSLESTSGIIQGLEEAGYRVSAATESVIASYQKAGLEAEAYELAIAEINRVLGPDGASLLSDYRIETENLSKEFEKAKAELDRELLPALTGTIRLILGLKEGFDQLAASPLFKFIQGANNLAGAGLPGFGDAGRTFNRLQELGAPSGEVVKPAEQTLAEEEAKLKILTQQTQELIKQQEKTWEANDAAREKIGIVDQQLIIEQNGANLANDKVYEARKEIIALQTQNKIKAANNALDVVALALAEKRVALAALENARNKALEAAAKAASRATASAPKSKALQLQQQEIQNQLKLSDIRARYKKLSEGDLAYYRALNVTAYDRLQQELKIIGLKEKQALAANKVAGDEALIKKRFEEQREIAKETVSLEQQQSIERINALETEKQILALRNQQNETGLRTDLGRQLEDINLQMDNPFGGFEAEQIELQVEQMRRYQDAISGVDNQIAILNKELITNTKLSDEEKNKREEQIKALERVKGVYEEMLPAIDAAEQKQLKLQQTLQALQPITDGLADGFSNMISAFIDGTQSAEKAFADMLTNMGKALVQEGTRMIAQYIAIGIARAFAGIGAAPDAGDAMNGGGILPAIANPGELPFGSLPGERAKGGPVNQNAPYIVGEEGPELFIPGRSGTIVSNDAFSDAAAAMTGASQAFADSSEAMAMATATRSANSAAAAEASAMQTAETYFASGKSTVSFDTYRVGEMDVVTREDAIKIGMQSAKQAEANVYKGLRNMPAVRGRTGVK